jgi:molybdenum cofactor biosynthesis protein B
MNETRTGLNIALLTVSDTRTLDTDTSGDLLSEMATADGHHIAAREIVTDDRAKIEAQLRIWVADAGIEVVVATGGTGLTGRDITPEAFESIYEKNIPGFGELFRWLSYQSIGTLTMQSRATAGIANGTYLFALPGSTSACRDGWTQILRQELDVQKTKCSLAALLPRLKE